MEKFQKNLYLIDAMALIYRAYYALNKNPRINSKGLNTSAILGFTNSFYEIIKKDNLTHIAVAFDTYGPTLRQIDYAEYKANRESTPEDIVLSLPYIRSIIDAFNIPLMELAGYEADDIIGTMAKKAENKGFTVYMVTSDKDYGQLVSDKVFMYKPAYLGNSISILGTKEICEKYSIQRPEQLIDILGLWGDASDNIPGIKGIGEVTAKKLIAEFGSIESLIENANNITNEKLRQKIEEGKEMALTSKMLATILLDVPIDFNEALLEIKEPNLNKLKQIFEELEFKNIAQRIYMNFVKSKENSDSPILPNLFSNSEKNQIAKSEASTFSSIHTTSHYYQLINSYEALEKLTLTLQNTSLICFDTETDGLDLIQVKLLGLSITTEPHKAYYIAMPSSYEETLRWMKLLKPVFENPSIQKIAQNLKFDMQVLQRFQVEVKGKCFDTMLAHYIIEPEMRHNLDFLAKSYLNYDPITYESLIGKDPKNNNLSQIPIEKVKDYACEDADITLQLFYLLENQLKEKDGDLLFNEVEMPLVPILASMEQKGMKIDTDFLISYAKKLQIKAEEIENKIIEYSGESFNVSSPKQLGIILFEKLKIIENAKLTKSKQYQTGEEVLQKLEHKHPIIPLILEYRGLMKLKSTYAEAFPTLVHSLTGRVHTSFNQAVTATGRLSSSNPNLQNIPIRNEEGREIRKAFIPANDFYILLAADYSQIELRLMAAMSGDESMFESFCNGEDIHAATASKIFNVPLNKVTREMRRNAKTVNFGIIYGISTFGLSERLNISRKEAAEIIEQYFEKYPKIKKFMESQKSFAKKNGYVETLMKRRRYLRDINSNNSIIRGVAERNAINAPIQGSAADMIKLAMIKIYNEIQNRKLKSFFVLQVHDELVFDVYKPELEEMKSIVYQGMINAMPITVPLEIDMKSGNNWLEAH
ncbi:MAG: DNA polymerase I [Bacteroidales bacterium]|nr:DNA polymerase I [Bacteroidales bacterium]MDD4209212.1 DNA polymerase I [Bacteroidales bacterium]